MKRGRPPGVMTQRRRQVLHEMTVAAAKGEPISLARLARSCGLYDYREAKRIIADLRKLGRASEIPPCFRAVRHHRTMN